MNKNKIFKILISILIAIILLTFLSQNAFAAFKNIATTFDGTGDNSNAGNKVTNILGAVINITRIICTGVAIIILIVIGIQFTSAAPEGKAEIKKTSTNYIIGAVILFSAVGLLSIAKKFIDKNINEI